MEKIPEDIARQFGKIETEGGPIYVGPGDLMPRALPEGWHRLSLSDLFTKAAQAAPKD